MITLPVLHPNVELASCETIFPEVTKEQEESYRTQYYRIISGHSLSSRKIIYLILGKQWKFIVGNYNSCSVTVSSHVQEFVHTQHVLDCQRRRLT